jgi:predicted alpha/beta superfamily hydrolase
LTRWHEYHEVYRQDNTVSGRVVVWPELPADLPGGPRAILAYLPPSLAERWSPTERGAPAEPGRRYPVLYFHDGQNVFDERTSNAGEWHADETLQALAGEGVEAIAVALPNGGSARMDEYNPWRSQPPFTRGHRFPRHEMGGQGDAYLAWLVDSVKPLVDRSFPVRTERGATGLVGSSMGGLISLYGLIAYPRIFGLAGVMSPSIGWDDYHLLRLVNEGGVPPARIHLDMGGREWSGMLPDARRLRNALLAQGWMEGRDLHYVEEHEATHDEGAWSRRLPDALRFLLAGTAQPR